MRDWIVTEIGVPFTVIATAALEKSALGMPKDQRSVPPNGVMSEGKSPSGYVPLGGHGMPLGAVPLPLKSNAYSALNESACPSAK